MTGIVSPSGVPWDLAPLQRWRDVVRDQPLVFFDLETTGRDASTAAIVEFGAVCYDAAAVEAAIAASTACGGIVLPSPAWQFAQRCNPGVPIPPSATRTHHISDADVADAPPVSVLAPSLPGLFSQFRLAGFNALRFDLPVIARLFQLSPTFAPIDVMGMTRAGERLPRPTGHVPWDVGGPIAVLGPVFGGSLGDAYASLRGRPMTGAHGAVADSIGTAEVLWTALLVWPDLPSEADYLSSACWVATLLVQPSEYGPMLMHGKYKGDLVTEVERVDSSYLGWLLHAEDVEPYCKQLVTEAIGPGRAAQLTEAQGRKRGRKGAAT